MSVLPNTVKIHAQLMRLDERLPDHEHWNKDGCRQTGVLFRVGRESAEALKLFDGLMVEMSVEVATRFYGGAMALPEGHELLKIQNMVAQLALLRQIVGPCRSFLCSDCNQTMQDCFAAGNKHTRAKDCDAERPCPHDLQVER